MKFQIKFNKISKKYSIKMHKYKNIIEKYVKINKKLNKFININNIWKIVEKHVKTQFFLHLFSTFFDHDTKQPFPKQPATLKEIQYLRDISTPSGASFHQYHILVWVDPLTLFRAAFSSLHNSEIWFGNWVCFHNTNDRLTELVPLDRGASVVYISTNKWRIWQSLDDMISWWRQQKRFWN